MNINEQTIIRAPRGGQSPYFLTARAPAQDSRLPFDARGLLWYILSKPDDWQIQIKDLMREGDIGKERAYRMLADLEKQGYAQRVEIRDEGRFAGMEYRIFEIPIKPPTPHPAKPDAAEPYPAKPQHTEYRDPQITENTQKQKEEAPAGAPLQRARVNDVTPSESKTATVADLENTSPPNPLPGFEGDLPDSQYDMLMAIHREQPITKRNGATRLALEQKGLIVIHDRKGWIMELTEAGRQYAEGLIAPDATPPAKATKSQKLKPRDKVLHPEHVEAVKQALVIALVDTGRWDADDLAPGDYALAERVACALCNRPKAFTAEDVGEFVEWVAENNSRRWATYNPAWLPNDVQAWRAAAADTLPVEIPDPERPKPPANPTPEQLENARIARELARRNADKQRAVLREVQS